LVEGVGMRFSAAAAVCVVLMLFVSCSATKTVSAQRNGWHIDPGVGYGPIKLGMSPDEVRARLGPPPPSPGPSINTLWRWPDALAVGFSVDQHTVNYVSIREQSGVTSGGARVGSTMDQVVGEFGGSSTSGSACNRITISTGGEWTMTIDYFKRGISFDFSVGASPRVKEIRIFLPRACP